MNISPGKVTVVRDVVSYVGGWLLIFKQAGVLFTPPDQVSPLLVILSALLIGVPGLVQLITLFVTGTSTGTGTRPSSPPSVESRLLPPGSLAGDDK